MLKGKAVSYIHHKTGSKAKHENLKRKRIIKQSKLKTITNHNSSTEGKVIMFQQCLKTFGLCSHTTLKPVSVILLTKH